MLFLHSTLYKYKHYLPSFTHKSASYLLQLLNKSITKLAPIKPTEPVTKTVFLSKHIYFFISISKKIVNYFFFIKFKIEKKASIFST